MSRAFVIRTADGREVIALGRSLGAVRSWAGREFPGGVLVVSRLVAVRLSGARMKGGRRVQRG